MLVLKQKKSTFVDNLQQQENFPLNWSGFHTRGVPGIFINTEKKNNLGSWLRPASFSGLSMLQYCLWAEVRRACWRKLDVKTVVRASWTVGVHPPLDVGLKSSAEFEALTQLKVLKTANFSFYYRNQLEVSDWMRPIRQDAAGVKESNTTLAANRLKCWFISNQVKFQSSQRIAWCWRDLSVAFDCKTFPEGAQGLWTLQRLFFFLTWSNFKCCDILGKCV